MFTIGLTLEKEAFRIAVLKREKKSIAIESLQTFPHGPDNVKLFYNLSPFHTGKEVHIVSGLANSDVFIRKLHLPLRDKRKILATLPFQLESLIPFSNENPIICPLLKPLSKQMTAVTVIATTQMHLSSLITALKEIDVEPDTISCHPIALVRFARWQFPQEFRILCFDVRDQKISCVLLEGKELILSQTIPLGEKQEPALELEKLSMFLKQKGAVDDQTPWLLTGDYNGFLTELLSRIFPGQKLELSDHHLTLYAVAVGLALDADAADRSSVQFCQKRFTPEHTLQMRKKKTVHYLGLCLIAALLMSVGGSFLLNKKQNKLIENLQNYLSSPISKESLSSANQIEEKLHEWENSLRGQKSSFAFLPTVPKVSDVLAWLSAHPAFATEEEGQKEGIEIKSIHYSLSKYPKIGDASSPYTAQVELEFTSVAPRSARDFHEALLKGDQIVNAKKEVKWQTQNQSYHTSFELNKGISS
jgi:type IV pilus assembly protein PilM